MDILHPSDIRAMLWPRRLMEIRRKLNRSSYIIITLGLFALMGNAFWVWMDRQAYLAQYNPFVLATWFHPAHVNSLVIAVIMLYAMRQVSKTRLKLSPLGYPLLEIEEQHRGVEIWKSVEPLTKRPVLLHVIRPDKFPVGQETWKSVSHRWIRRSEKARRLTSPHIARVMDVGYAQHERFYTALELPRGVRMTDLVEQQGALPLNRAIFIMAQVAHAIQDAHENGLNEISIHPRHIWIGHRSSNSDWVTLMLSGYESDVDATVGARDDLRQFALITLGLLAGAWPDEPKTPSQVEALVRGVDLPYELAQVIQRCLLVQSSDELPPIDEIARRMWASVPGASWNNDHAVAWWKEHQADVTRT